MFIFFMDLERCGMEKLVLYSEYKFEFKLRPTLKWLMSLKVTNFIPHRNLQANLGTLTQTLTETLIVTLPESLPGIHQAGKMCR